MLAAAEAVMREIVMDTETTGLDPVQGHRIIEIGGIELIHHVPTGRHFHEYVNPERDIPADAFAVMVLAPTSLAPSAYLRRSFKSSSISWAMRR